MALGKVRVTKFYGGADTMGVMDPKVGMQTDQGKIITLNDSTVTASGDTVRIFSDHYAEHLLVLESEALDNWSWPTGDGSVVFGRSVSWPDGVPDVAESGMAYATGHGAPVLFSR